MKWHEKEPEYGGTHADVQMAIGRNKAIDQARQAVEEAVSLEKIHGAMWETHRIGENHEEQFDLEVMNIYATAIRKQIMDELFGTERGV